ncbi:MAG: hypothetical protein CSA58_06410 [Micrococcales bacterium]|nr:MAG: hypothetical protein CSB46_09810 [Micrococcales bacterium]PIE26989.1 MAG: hypothetical protein CSA58_06410 [Micrococcales bacterium]
MKRRGGAEPTGETSHAIATFSGLLGASGTALFIDQAMAWIVPGRHANVLTYRLSLMSVAVAAVAVALVVFRLRRRIRPAGLLEAMTATTVLSVIHLVAEDTTAGSTMFQILPVLYLAYHRPKNEALIGAGYASVATSFVALRLQPLASGLHNSLYVPVILLSVAFLVSRAREAQQEAEGQLRRQASVDALTGLATRSVFDTEATRAVAQRNAALILLDVDWFKQINDSYGHPVGDAVLQHVSARVQSQTRSTDLACRMGGDELALFLPGCTQFAAQQRAEQLMAEVADQPFTVSRGDSSILIAVGVSVGVGYAQRGRTLAELYSAADASLYRAKHRGRGRLGPIQYAQPTGPPAPELPG